MRSLRLIALAALAPLCLSSCYVLKVGTQFLSLQSRTVSVQEMLKRPAVSPADKAFLERAQDVRSFAMQGLGLKNSKNYTRFGNPGRDHIADIVQACDELSFTRHYWEYPLVGKLPYQGYFNLQDAEKAAKALKKKGLDVIVRPTDAFSTLGFFVDPLWSFMRDYTEGDLAELIVHELTHATVFPKGQGDFNEEFAQFVGERGSLLYLRSRHGADSPAERALLSERLSRDRFQSFLFETANQLEALYARKLPPAQARAEKAAIIARRAEEYKGLPEDYFPDPGYRAFDMGKINNAYIDLYRLYLGESSLYGDYLDKVCGGDLRACVARVAALSKKSKDVKAALRQELAVTLRQEIKAAAPINLP
jgi:predicted aminopeptidase